MYVCVCKREWVCVYYRFLWVSTSRVFGPQKTIVEPRAMWEWTQSHVAGKQSSYHRATPSFGFLSLLNWVECVLNYTVKNPIFLMVQYSNGIRALWVRDPWLSINNIPPFYNINIWTSFTIILRSILFKPKSFLSDSFFHLNQLRITEGWPCGK